MDNGWATTMSGLQKRCCSAKVNSMKLKDIRILGTVSGGKAFDL